MTSDSVTLDNGKRVPLLGLTSVRQRLETLFCGSQEAYRHLVIRCLHPTHQMPEAIELTLKDRLFIDNKTGQISDEITKNVIDHSTVILHDGTILFDAIVFQLIRKIEALRKTHFDVLVDKCQGKEAFGYSQDLRALGLIDVHSKPLPIVKAIITNCLIDSKLVTPLSVKQLALLR